MSGPPARVLFVADGPAGGGAAAAAVGADPAVSLLGRCADAAGGAAQIEALDPDVVVLYVTAPAGPGRAALLRAAQARETPVVVVEGAGESFAALRARVRAAAAGRRPRPPRPGAPLPASRAIRLIAIGASTGGVEALERVLTRFPADAPPTVVVQHMPHGFTGNFAARLNQLCAPQVAEAWDGAPLETGRVYIAPGGAAHLEVQAGAGRCVRLSASEPVNRHRPSIDVAFASIARAGAQGVVAALLTGMGRDGAEGLRLIREAGGRTIAQDRESSTVYGMPRAALEIGAVDHGTPLDRIAEAIFTPQSLCKEPI